MKTPKNSGPLPDTIEQDPLQGKKLERTPVKAPARGIQRELPAPPLIGTFLGNFLLQPWSFIMNWKWFPTSFH